MYDVICSHSRAQQYRLLRIEWKLFKQTQEALAAWASIAIEENIEANELYYSTLGKLAQANQRCVIRVNEIRKRLGLPPFVDTATYPVKQPLDD